MQVYEIRDEFGLDHLVRVERPQPEPSSTELLVKMRAWSLNYRDLLTVTGQYNPRMPLPRVPLSDGVGEVVAAGNAVTRVNVGDRVAGIFLQDWIEGEISPDKTNSDLGGGIDGVLAEYVLFNEQGVVRVPEHLSDEEAATLPCAAVTAWNALVEDDRVKPGETVLLLGTGGVSLFALQFSRLLGARAIITSKSDEKLSRAADLGAWETINYATTPEWYKRVLELTEGRGVDHVVEVGGSGTLPQSLRAVRVGGRISLIGILGGVGEMNPLPIVMRRLRVQGIYVGSGASFEAMNNAIASSGLRPVIDKTFGFDEAVEALRYLESGAHFGKIVIRR